MTLAPTLRASNLVDVSFGVAPKLVIARSLALCAIFAIVLRATTSLAQDPSAASGPRETERTNLYKEGVALADAGKWEGALEKFRAVVAIRSAPAALIALGTAQENTGKLAHAVRTYEAAEQGARAANDEALADRAHQASAALRSRIARLIVRIPPGEPAATVTVDGETVEAAAAGIAVDPGKHRVVAAAAGRKPFEREIEVRAGGQAEVAVVFESQPAPATAAPATPAAAIAPVAPGEATERSVPSGRPLPVGPLVLGGVGVAATVVGIVVRLGGNADYDEASKECVDSRCDSQTAVDNGNAARGRMLTGTIVAGVGVAALAGAGVWWALPAKTESQGARPKPTFAVRVTTLPNGAMFGARGCF